jgi:hypothetical protein
MCFWDCFGVTKLLNKVEIYVFLKLYIYFINFYVYYSKTMFNFETVLNFLVPALVGFNITLFILNFFVFKFWNRHKPKEKGLKLLAVIGSGGHTTEMLKLLTNLLANDHQEVKKFYHRVYVLAETDRMGSEKV